MKTTIEQQRAANALARVQELNARSDGFKKRYRSYVDRLGPGIVMNGLGQALATERAVAGPPPLDPAASTPGDAADKEAHRELYTSLHQWLCRADGGIYPNERDLLSAIVSHGQSEYLHAQAEALSWLEWHKKCCRAAYPKDERGLTQSTQRPSSPHASGAAEGCGEEA